MSDVGRRSIYRLSAIDSLLPLAKGQHFFILSALCSVRLFRLKNLEPIPRFLEQTSLVNPSEEYFSALLTHLGDKLTSGSGETLFEVGVGGKCRNSEPNTVS